MRHNKLLPAAEDERDATNEYHGSGGGGNDTTIIDAKVTTRRQQRNTFATTTNTNNNDKQPHHHHSSSKIERHRQQAQAKANHKNNKRYHHHHHHRQQHEKLKRRVEEEIKHKYKEEVISAITRLESRAKKNHHPRHHAAVENETNHVNDPKQHNIILSEDVIAALTKKNNWHESQQQHHHHRQQLRKKQAQIIINDINKRDGGVVNNNNSIDTTTTITYSKNKLQVDEVIAAVRKHYGQLQQQRQPPQQRRRNQIVNHDRSSEKKKRSNNNTNNVNEGCSLNNIPTTTAAASTTNTKEVGNNTKSSRRQTKKKYEKMQKKEWKKNDVIKNHHDKTFRRRGNDHKTFVHKRSHDDHDDDSGDDYSLPDNGDNNKAKGNNDIQHQDDDDDNTKGGTNSTGGDCSTPQHNQSYNNDDDDDDESTTTIQNDIIQTTTSIISNIMTVTTTDEEDNIHLLPQTLFYTSTIRTKEDLKTQRRHGIKVQTFHNYYNNEDDVDGGEDFENVECNLDYEEMVPDVLYRFQFSNRFVNSDDEKNDDDKKNDDDDDDGEKREVVVSRQQEVARKEQDGEEEMKIMEVNALGKNGWHRILKLLQQSTPNATLSVSASSSDDKLIPSLLPTLKTLAESDDNNIESIINNRYNATLDQLTAINVLENPHHPQYAPILSEEDALRDEYETLQREIESLEKDRLALESQFHETEVAKKKLMMRLKQNKQDSWWYMIGDDEEEGGEQSYRKFRQKLGYMKNEELLSILPSMLWMEDIQLDSPRLLPHHHRHHHHHHRNNNRRNRQGKDTKQNRTNNYDSYSIVSNKMDPKFQKSVREHRGMGLALLIADSECRNELIGHCYARYYMNNKNNGKQDYDEIMSSLTPKPTLRVEGVATLINGGGEFLRSCCLIGQASLHGDGQHHSTKEKYNCGGNTSYFLKFDGGKSYHHGSLPSNLMNRLSREKKEVKAIRYLSIGPLLYGSLSSESDGGGERCYYLEFDDGECWWNVPVSEGEQDNDLERIFSQVNIHRVAFGCSSDNLGASASWIVIGKNGSVFYRNIPQGLHDALTARNAAESHAAPCEVSLGMSASYFIRFLDGSVDYNLPKFAADVFDKLELQGAMIRNVSLHVDTADCLIRFQ